MLDLALFTGFPGFIGARLLPRLLALQPELSCACLVQDKFLDLARTSVESIEASYSHARGRISIVPGDITQVGLGLADDDARALRQRLVAVYHLAAVYDLAVTRDLALRVNVEGTRNVLRFLQDTKHGARLHYVSTAYVSGNASGVYRETDLDVGQAFKNFYEETKFLAEVEVARSGLPATIYRPAIVVGDSRTGETAKFDGPYFTLRAMTRVPSPGIFLKVGSGRSPINLVPVDFMVEALARLASSRDSIGGTYHLTDPQPCSVFEVEQLFAHALGKRFAYVPVPRRLARLLLSPTVVQKALGLPVATVDYFDQPTHYDCSLASAALAPLDVTCPHLRTYVERLVAFYLETRGARRRSAMA